MKRGLAMPIGVMTVLLLASCVSETTKIPPRLPAAATPAQNASRSTPADSTPKSSSGPVLTFWENGDFRQGRNPSILFALWADGTVVRNIDGHLYLGKITILEAKAVIESLEIAGVDQSPLSTGAVYPDGPSQLLWVKLNNQEIALTHDTNYAWQDLEQVAPASSPQHQQVEEFVEMWGRAVSTIYAIWPSKLEQIQFVPGLHYPAIRR